MRPAYFGLNELDFRKKFRKVLKKKPANGHAMKHCDHKQKWCSKKAFYWVKFTYFCPRGRKMQF